MNTRSINPSLINIHRRSQSTRYNFVNPCRQIQNSDFVLSGKDVLACHQDQCCVALATSLCTSVVSVPLISDRTLIQNNPFLPLCGGSLVQSTPAVIFIGQLPVVKLHDKTAQTQQLPFKSCFSACGIIHPV